MNIKIFKTITTIVFLLGLSSIQAGNPTLQDALKSTSSGNSIIPAATSKQKTDVYIVQFKDSPLIAYDGSIANLSATKPEKGQRLAMQSSAVKNYRGFLKNKHKAVLDACGVPERNKIYTYTNSFNGVAAQMTEAQAEEARRHRDVVRVWKDEMRKMETDSTYKFFGLPNGERGAWNNKIVGEDVIVGVIDSGIYPEHPSFADVKTPKFGDHGRRIRYGEPPTDWSGDECNFGNSTFNSDDADFECNNKLLGARSYSAGFLRGGDPAVVLAPQSSLSARDDDGHGSAAASNAAGNYGVRAQINGERVGKGLMSGVAPRARIAVYKVCWNGPIPGTDDDGCFSSDSMAAIDQAVADGVDVINFSIGGSSTSFGAPDSVAFLFAADAGVHVATSAGNAGSNSATVGAPGIVPWITSVGATNDNQNFAKAVDISAPVSIAGLKTAIEGAGSVTLEDAGPISGDIAIADPADGCTALTNAAEIDGNIALVIRGGCAFDDKYAAAEAAGATAIIVYNDGTAADRQDPFVMGGIDPSRGIVGMMISFADGNEIASETGVVATLDDANQISLKNTVADFSSRGPNLGALDIIKPDVAAPGVNILSAETPFENTDSGSGGEEFQYISGTSFSSPHVAGVMALLKQKYPDWSPAAVRSALMTTARQNIGYEFNDETADAFDIGAGHVVPNRSLNPGLVYEADLLDYAAFSCGNNVQLFDDAVCDFLNIAGYSFDGSELNLPSIGVGELVGAQTVTRTVTNVSKKRGKTTFKAKVDAPEGVDVSVSPSKLTLRRGESADYTVTFNVNDNAVANEFTFGSITWTNRGQGSGNYNKRNPKYNVRSPIAVQPVVFVSEGEVDVSGVAGSASVPIQFGYNGPYSADFIGLSEGLPIVDTVTEVDGLKAYCFDLPAHRQFRVATFDADTGSPGADDLDLRVFTVTDCASFANLTQIGGSGGITSEEVIDVVDPAAGGYVVAVDYYAAATGTEIDYTAWVYAVFDGDNAGSPTVSAPTSAVAGASDTVVIDYSGLDPDSRYLGVLSHNNGSEEIDRSIIDVDTQ